MSKMYDVIVIGAGPAGLSAALYAGRARLKTLVVEKKKEGGQIALTSEVENYPGCVEGESGPTLIDRMYNQAKHFGAEFVYDEIESVDLQGSIKQLNGKKDVYKSKAVIVATGASSRPIGCPGEKEFIGKGVSYCATCDGMFFRGRDVAVVGGGNTALEDAMFLSNYCNKVYIIHRRDKLRGEEKIAKAISEKDNIEMVWNSNVVKLIGDDKVEGITVKNSVDGSEKDIQVSGLFIAVGQEPDNYDFEEVVELDDKGYVIAGEDCKTESKGIFTAGDCRTKNVRQLTTAASDGAVAAIGACEYIDSELDTKNTK